MISDPLAVFLVLAGSVLLSVLLEERIPQLRVLGSALIAILLAALLSNVGLLPPRSAAYDLLGGAGVNIAVALILLSIDFRSLARAGTDMLRAFFLGAAGTAVGATIGALAVGAAVGEEAWKLAGQYAGTYTGGSVNFVAVGRALDTGPELFAAAVAADNVVTTLWVAACFALPVALRRWWPDETSEGRDETPRPESVEAASLFERSRRQVTLHDLAALGTLAAVCWWLSELLAVVWPLVPSVLWLSSVALILAQVPTVRELAGGALAGNYLLHMFLAAIGAQSVVVEILRFGPSVFVFAVITVGFHGLFVFAGGRLLGIDLPTLAVASQANVGGPASAMALATARAYDRLVLPGVAVGLFGYAAGTYAGLGVATLMRALLG